MAQNQEIDVAGRLVEICASLKQLRGERQRKQLECMQLQTLCTEFDTKETALLNELSALANVQAATDAVGATHQDRASRSDLTYYSAWVKSDVR